MDHVREEELGEEGGDDIAEEDDAFGNRGAHQVEGCREDYYIEYIINESWVYWLTKSDRHITSQSTERGNACSPNSQKATQTLGSAPLKTAANLDLYMVQDAAGDPGRGSMLLLKCCIELHRWRLLVQRDGQSSVHVSFLCVKGRARRSLIPRTQYRDFTGIAQLTIQM